MSQFRITTQDELPRPDGDKPHVLSVNQTEYGNARLLRTNVLSARPDLKKYKALSFQQDVKRHSEVAAVGQGGMQISEPGTCRSIKTLPGSWSDLALACLIHVGIKRLMPNEDSGLGVEAEYEEAVRLQGSQAETMRTLHSFGMAE